jgi:hypothetical protein
VNALLIIDDLCCRFSKRIQVVIPICIAGFPYLLFEEAFRRSIDTLPIYRGEECCDEEEADHLLDELAQSLANDAIYSALNTPK